MKLLQTGLFRRTGTKNEYRTNCPFCGDRKLHMYVYIDLDSDESVRYHCFKCPARGYLNNGLLLEKLGLDNIQIPKGIKTFKRLSVDNKVSDRIDIVTVDDGDDISVVQSYIQSRVGVIPNINDLISFQYIGNPNMYVKDYLGDQYSYMLKDRVWFKLTNGSIIGRWDLNDDDCIGYRWVRYKTNRIKDSGMYQMKTPVDIQSEINVIIAEGIMDVIGLYFNYNELVNRMFIASCGKDYSRGMYHMINKGIFGDSVNIHIFKDPNVPCDKIIIPKHLRALFNKVYIYGNTLGKDYGVLPNELSIHRLEKR